MANTPNQLPTIGMNFSRLIDKAGCKVTYREYVCSRGYCHSQINGDYLASMVKLVSPIVTSGGKSLTYFGWTDMGLHPVRSKGLFYVYKLP